MKTRNTNTAPAANKRDSGQPRAMKISMTRGDLLTTCIRALPPGNKFAESCCVNVIVPVIADDENVTMPHGFQTWAEVVAMVVCAAAAQSKLEQAAPTITEQLINTAAKDPNLSLADLQLAGLVKLPRKVEINDLSAKELLWDCKINFRDLVKFCHRMNAQRDNRQVRADNRHVPSFYMSLNFTITDQWIVFDGGISLAACDRESAAIVIGELMENSVMDPENFSKKKK